MYLPPKRKGADWFSIDIDAAIKLIKFFIKNPIYYFAGSLSNICCLFQFKGLEPF